MKGDNYIYRDNCGGRVRWQEADKEGRREGGRKIGRERYRRSGRKRWRQETGRKDDEE